MTIYKSGKAINTLKAVKLPKPLKPLGQRTGQSHHPLYQTWSGMWDRCTNKDNLSYDDYGARGISVCERWRDFDFFLEDMGPKPTKNHSLDREDNEKGYSPRNCRWATATEQARNRRNTVRVEFQGKVMFLADALALGFKTSKSYMTIGNIRVYNRGRAFVGDTARTRGIQWVTKA